MNRVLQSDFAANAQFLQFGDSKRYCVYFKPTSEAQLKGGIIFCPPFAEEMNLSRHVVSTHARQLSSLGYGVLVVDLFGTGDSDGNLEDANWSIWTDDILIAVKLLHDEVKKPITLWGLRLGCLLAISAHQKNSINVEKLILWQPVLNGKTYLNQFFRLQLAKELLNSSDEKLNIRQELTITNLQEIAGYCISQNLVQSIDDAQMEIDKNLLPTTHWIECQINSSSQLSIGRQTSFNDLDVKTDSLQLHIVQSPVFWQEQESASPDLLLATSAQVLS